MSLDIRRAAIVGIRAALDPVEITTKRPSTVEIPSGWLRTPSTSPGRIQSLPEAKESLVYLDLWERGEGELDDLYQKLGFMDGLMTSHGSARRIIYREASWTVIRESEESWHGTLMWRVSFADGRVVMRT